MLCILHPTKITSLMIADLFGFLVFDQQRATDKWWKNCHENEMKWTKIKTQSTACIHLFNSNVTSTNISTITHFVAQEHFLPRFSFHTGVCNPFWAVKELISPAKWIPFCSTDWRWQVIGSSMRLRVGVVYFIQLFVYGTYYIYYCFLLYLLVCS